MKFIDIILLLKQLMQANILNYVLIFQQYRITLLGKFSGRFVPLFEYYNKYKLTEKKLK